MRIFLILLTTLITFFSFENTFSAIKESDLNVRNTNVGDSGNENEVLGRFMESIDEFFFAPDTTGWGSAVLNAFIQVAFNIKNFFLAIAVIFLIIGVLKLLFAGGDEERVKKWKSNIIYVSIGIFVMQLAFSIWNTLMINDPNAGVSSILGWQMWVNIFSPLVGMLQVLASFGFFAMMVYAFFMIVTGGGDEEKLKKWKNIVIYAIIGFLLIRLPRAFISAIYGSPDCKESEFLWTDECAIKDQDIQASVGIVADIFNYLNTFLGIVCVILIIYAGWLVFISGGDEEKLKKAKNIILYIFIGLIILVSSHAIFRFFILNG